MGAFFTNVQVRTDLHGAEATRQAILETLAARAHREGFSPCAEGAHADRTIVVGPPGRWIAIYDEATEDQRLEPLDELTRAMSEVAGGPAVGVLVHDSDWLLLRLFDAGSSVDVFERGVDKEKGTLAAWASLCEREEDIASAFKRRDLDAEDTLRDIASAVGMAPTNASTGYEYLRDAGPLPDGSTVLRCRLRERPAHEQLALVSAAVDDEALSTDPSGGGDAPVNTDATLLR